MDRDKKRSLVFGIIIILAISGSVIYFLWGNFINRGTLEINGDAPFIVEVYGQGRHECSFSPCRIKLKSGSKDLILSKEKHQPVIRNFEIKLWRTIKIDIEFPPIPQIAETDNIPAVSETSEYILVFDKKNRMQKLVDSNDQTETVIAYFPKPINNSLIISGPNSALILDRSNKKGEGFIIDVKNKTREKINTSDLNDLTFGNWSEGGTYMVFQKQNSSYLWLLNSKEKTVQKLDLTVLSTHISWIYNDNLIFVTDQSYKSEDALDVKLLNEKSFIGFTFGIYNPSENTYRKIETFSEIKQLPDKLIATDNGKAVYFQIGNKNFSIILR